MDFAPPGLHSTVLIVHGAGEHADDAACAGIEAGVQQSPPALRSTMPRCDFAADRRRGEDNSDRAQSILALGGNCWQVFRDLAQCAEKAVVPAGNFMMGSMESNDEVPLHCVDHCVACMAMPSFVRLKNA